MSVSSSCLVYSRLKPSLVSVLISVLISVSISVPISIRGQTRYGLGLISKKPSSLKKKPSFIQEKTEFFSSENRGQNKRPLGFLRWQLKQEYPAEVSVDPDLNCIVTRTVQMRHAEENIRSQYTTNEFWGFTAAQPSTKHYLKMKDGNRTVNIHN